jgi:hypothetical protein
MIVVRAMIEEHDNHEENLPEHEPLHRHRHKKAATSPDWLHQYWLELFILLGIGVAIF